MELWWHSNSLVYPKTLQSQRRRLMFPLEYFWGGSWFYLAEGRRVSGCLTQEHEDQVELQCVGEA